MYVVIDAQVLSSYYQAEVLDVTTDCSGDPRDLISQLGNADVALIDKGGIIESEWKNQADSDWFEIWLAARLSQGDIEMIDVDTCTSLMRELKKQHGFPAKGRDKWYVCTARTRAASAEESVALISEDVDFFEPKAKKNPKQRSKFLSQGGGAVAKALRANAVDPRTVRQHNAQS